MKTLRAVAWIVSLGSTALLSSCDNEQPRPQCTVGRGEHAVRYVLVSGSGTCANKTAEIVGAQIFRTPGSGIPPSVVFKPAPLAANTGKDPSEENSITATGDFTTEYPGDDEVCEAPSFSEARQLVVQADGTTTVDTRYQWSNVRVQGSAAIPGTQWTADLVYSEGGCTATYRAVGMFPAIRCLRSGMRDPAVCKQPQPGLSIDPAFPTTCDESTNLCVLAGEPPVLLPQQ